jgi:hypothetical protein
MTRTSWISPFMAGWSGDVVVDRSACTEPGQHRFLGHHWPGEVKTK